MSTSKRYFLININKQQLVFIIQNNLQERDKSENFTNCYELPSKLTLEGKSEGKMRGNVDDFISPFGNSNDVMKKSFKLLLIQIVGM